MTILPDGTVQIRNKQSGETKTVKPEELPNYGISYSDYQTQYNAFNELNGGAPKAARDQAAKDTIKKQATAKSATNLLDTVSNGGNADAVNNAASDFNSNIAFGEGGKQVTANERAMLSGKLINQNTNNPNILQKVGGFITGSMPNPTTTVNDSPEQIKAKAIAAIKAANPNADVSKYEAMTPEQVQKSPGIMQWLGETAANVPKNAGDIGTSLLNLPKHVVDTYMNGGNANDLLTEMATGTVKNLADTVGISAKKDPNSIIPSLEFSPQAALQHLHDKPVDTALNILPLVGGAKALMGADAVGEAGVAAEGADAARNMNGITGRAATGIAVPDPESVVRSQELMGKAAQMTRSTTPRAMAVELEQLKPKLNEAIGKYADKLDSVVGPQPMEDVKSIIETKLADSLVGQAAPELIKKVITDLQTKMKSGYMPDGQGGDGLEATNFAAMNKARQNMNSGLDSWFNGGREVNSPSGQIASLRWEASKALKDIMSEADTTGYFKKAIDMQHTAIETIPAISKKVLTGGGGGNPRSVVGAGIHAAGAVANSVLNPVKIGLAKMGAEASPLVQQILEGRVPDIPLTPPEIPTAPTVTTSQTAPQPITGPNVYQTPAEPVNLLDTVGKRDMRYKQGNYRPRVR